MQAVKHCSLHIPLLFGWQSCWQQCNFMYDPLFPPDPKGTALTQAWLTPHRGDYQRYTVFPVANTKTTNTHLICAVSLRSGLISSLGRAEVKALPAISHLLLLLDVALGLAAVQAAHGAGQPFLQGVGGALGARGALDGVEGWLRL